MDLIHAIHEEKGEPEPLQGLPFCVAVIFLAPQPENFEML